MTGVPTDCSASRHHLSPFTTEYHQYPTECHCDVINEQGLLL